MFQKQQKKIEAVVGRYIQRDNHHPNAITFSAKGCEWFIDIFLFKCVPFYALHSTDKNTVR